MRAGDAYRFVTNWQVEASCEDVSDVLEDTDRIAGWWPSVYRECTIEERGGTHALGRRVAVTTKGFLPYLIHWRFTVVEVNYPYGSRIVADGDLEGEGRWVLRPDETGPPSRTSGPCAPTTISSAAFRGCWGRCSPRTITTRCAPACAVCGVNSRLGRVARGDVREGLIEAGKGGVAVDFEQVGRVAGVAPVFDKGEFVAVGRGEFLETRVVVVLGIDERVDPVTEVVLQRRARERQFVNDVAASVNARRSGGWFAVRLWIVMMPLRDISISCGQVVWRFPCVVVPTKFVCTNIVAGKRYRRSRGKAFS